MNPDTAPAPRPATPALAGGTTLFPARRSLARRLRAASWRLGAAALVGLVAFAAVWLSTDVTGWSDAQLGLSMMGDVAGGFTALALVPFRHRAPRVVAFAIMALAGFSTLAFGAALLALVSLATRRRPPEIILGAVILGASVGAAEVIAFRATDDGTSIWWIVAYIAVVMVGYALVALIGVVIGSRRALVASLRERAVLVEREQALREEHARDAERAHLAREMHDVLGHRLSLVALHAGALEYRGRDLSTAETVEAAGIVRAEAHSALTDLRDVLGMLRDPMTTAGSEVTVTAPPQPTLLDLDALFDEARAAGASIETVVDAETSARMATVPTAVSRHAYRVVQEALTNARRHCPGQPVRVSGGILDDAVHVLVTNPVTDGAVAVRPGHGLTGLDERARLLDGRFRAGIVGDEFVVEAELPWS